MSVLEGQLGLRATRHEDGRTVLAEQFFQAPFHLSKPHWEPAAEVLHVQVVNPTAGILAGDALRSEVTVEAGAAVLISTPSATRIFKMDADGAATSTQRWQVAAGGWLEVMPEPLVPHRGSRFHQETIVEAEPGAGVLLIDQLMPGRLAHGEAWQWDRLVLGLTVRIGGELVLRERFDHGGPALQALSEFHGTGPAACFANLLLVLPDIDVAPAWRTEVQGLHAAGVWLGVTALRGSAWSLRIIAPGPIALRDTLASVRAILREAYPRLGCSLRRP